MSPCECDSRWTCTRCKVTRCRECDCEVYETIDDETYCGDCTKAIIEEHKSEIEELVAQVKLTGELVVYEPEHRSAPTREEYAAGFREAYTENSVRAYNRHSRTNYDKLIKDLDPDDALSRAAYEAVRRRVGELLGEDEY